jgi:hypothetical protein
MLAPPDRYLRIATEVGLPQPPGPVRLLESEDRFGGELEIKRHERQGGCGSVARFLQSGKKQEGSVAHG